MSAEAWDDVMHTDTETAAELAAQAEATEPETEGNSWDSLDLKEIVMGLRLGTIDRPRATIGERLDGTALFYAGRVNGLYGDSTAGKTFTALLACKQEMEKGNAAVFIDFEDDEIGTVERLMDMGVSDEIIIERFIYLRPDEKFSQKATDKVLTLITEREPTLVIVDSTGESIAVEGMKPNDDDEVARWARKLPKWIAKLGPSVLVIDHQTKDSNGGLWPIGSQRKRAMITGAAYVQDAVVGFAKGKAGFSQLKCSKDRRGGFATGEVVADLHVRPDVEGENEVRIELRAPVDAEAVKLAEEVALLHSVARALTKQHGEGKDFVTTKVLRSVVVGTGVKVDKAAAILAEEGYAVYVKGRGYKLTRPYSMFGAEDE